MKPFLFLFLFSGIDSIRSVDSTTFETFLFYLFLANKVLGLGIKVTIDGKKVKIRKITHKNKIGFVFADKKGNEYDPLQFDSYSFFTVDFGKCSDPIVTNILPYLDVQFMVSKTHKLEYITEKVNSIIGTFSENHTIAFDRQVKDTLWDLRSNARRLNDDISTTISSIIDAFENLEHYYSISEDNDGLRYTILKYVSGHFGYAYEWSLTEYPINKKLLYDLAVEYKKMREDIDQQYLRKQKAAMSFAEESSDDEN